MQIFPDSANIIPLASIDQNKPVPRRFEKRMLARENDSDEDAQSELKYKTKRIRIETKNIKKNTPNGNLITYNTYI